MADAKISALPAATTPVAGTEVLPIVQSGATKKVSIDNLTAGKTVSASTFTSTVATGTAPLAVTSTTEVANLRAATATLADTASAVKSNATTGVMTITGPGAGTNRVATIPNANFTVARTDAGQDFSGEQVFLAKMIVGIAGATFDAFEFVYPNVGQRAAIGLVNFDAFLRLYTGANVKTVEILALGTSVFGGGSVQTSGDFILSVANKGLVFSGNGSVIWRTGAGTPEGAVTAPVGSLYTRTDGGAGTTLYVKESGAGDTGWVAK